LKSEYVFWPLTRLEACFDKMNGHMLSDSQMTLLRHFSFLRMKVPLLWYNVNFHAKCVWNEMHLKCFGLEERC